MTNVSGELELRTRISRVLFEGREYRVIRAERPARRLVVFDQTSWLGGYADRVAIKQLATLWALASGSPRSVVYVPMRQNAAPYEASGGRGLDMVLTHHSLQFRASRWTKIRGRLGVGAAHTVRIPDPGTPKIDYSDFMYAENIDLLRFDNAADTLFVTGSRQSFYQGAVDLRKLLEEAAGPAPEHHACAEIESGRYDRSPPGHKTPDLLHIQYEPTDW